MTATIKEFLFRAAMMVHLQIHFSYPPYDLFAHRLFATIVKDLSTKKTISDGVITVDFWIIKDHTSD